MTLADRLRGEQHALDGAYRHPDDGPSQTGALLIAAADALDESLAELARLRTALEELVIDANRLCDRQLGGTYEDDCVRSIAKARAALTSEVR